MTISYNWLLQYLPEPIDIDKISRILTAVGLEVESITPYENIKGSLQGLVVGKVLSCIQHPDADKLKVTNVDVALAEPLQIVCGATNVAVNQYVVVATIGTTLYPTTGEAFKIKKSKIRGVESQGMLCAEDEIGIGNSHAGILVLPTTLTIGSPIADYYKPYTDSIIEIGLTPNHMDAQSHIGVARDVIAYYNHHNKTGWQLKTPYPSVFKPDSKEDSFTLTLAPGAQCERYSAVVISNVTVATSPVWLQHKLQAIGLRPINNVVDATNYVLHETGQPLHAFDYNAVTGQQILVQPATQGQAFTKLDGKNITLTANDIMVCNSTEPMCIGGIYGGATSGVTTATTRILLESAIFNPTLIRKTSLHHGLRTDAAIRFEKGVDISNTVNILKHAALLIKEIVGGNITSDVIDIYPEPKAKVSVSIKYHYLKKLSGKNYHPETVKHILQYLGFEISKDGIDELTVLVPYHKTDITIPADLVEEIMRIDGLDNIEIPKSITITPQIATNNEALKLKEKIAQTLVGCGLQEILTNSITNSANNTPEQQALAVVMLNNLAENLNALRVSMLQTGLASIAHNINRKNNNLQFFEFGRVYHHSNQQYTEQEQLAIYLTGNTAVPNWNSPTQAVSIYTAKMIAEKILHSCGVTFTTTVSEGKCIYHNEKIYEVEKKPLITVQAIAKNTLKLYDVKQPVYYIECDWQSITTQASKVTITYTEPSKYPLVQRDIALLVSTTTTYSHIQAAIEKANVKKLSSINLFDVFVNAKLGDDKKSMALTLTFTDTDKTLTDKEVDGFVQKIISNLQKEVQAELRA